MLATIDPVLAFVWCVGLAFYGRLLARETSRGIQISWARVAVFGTTLSAVVFTGLLASLVMPSLWDIG